MARRDGWRIPQQIENPVFRYLPADLQASWKRAEPSAVGSVRSLV
jgi:hypothetical protein